MRIVRAAAAVVVGADGRLLLIRRGTDPQRGRWSVPGGRVEPGETVAEAAVREAFEETGARVRAGRELGMVRVPGGPDVVYEVHDVAATYLGGTLRPGDDADEVRWVAPAELSALPTTDGLLEHLARFGIPVR
ncbi:NUDIX domain-containing protein [Kocuria sediminis]|uniref:NUDIX domain-containing protein n=1 Tax=Kocuria sediminis TaxID=1038857 RepID=A0A6N8GKD8_9MICC|nr:NUDIX domain-containing protein [Kocuria sediminis]MUN63209.1 NUDIX domain-containing protein [Kocuria sediminis]